MVWIGHLPINVQPLSAIKTLQFLLHISIGVSGSVGRVFDSKSGGPRIASSHGRVTCVIFDCLFFTFTELQRWSITVSFRQKEFSDNFLNFLIDPNQSIACISFILMYTMFCVKSTETNIIIISVFMSSKPTKNILAMTEM